MVGSRREIISPRKIMNWDKVQSNWVELISNWIGRAVGWFTQVHDKGIQCKCNSLVTSPGFVASTAVR